MINKLCKTGGFKLPHMSKSPIAYHEKGHMVKAEKPTIKNPKTTEEEQLEAAKETLKQISQKPLLEPKPLNPEMRGPINFDHDDDPVFKSQPDDKVPSFDETFRSSSGGDEFDVDYSGAKPVDLGTVKLSDEGRSVKGFRDEFGNYMGREFKGNDERLGRITPQQNFQEAMRELPEKYFDLERGKLRLVPTDDAEMPDENFKSKLKPYQLFNPEMFSDQQPKDE